MSTIVDNSRGRNCGSPLSRRRFSDGVIEPTISLDFPTDCFRESLVTEPVLQDLTTPGATGYRQTLPWLGSPFLAGWPVLGPLVTLLVITGLLRGFPIDLWISAWFYDATTHSWPYFGSAICIGFYRAGIYPAIAIACYGGYLAIVGTFPRFRADQWRAGVFLLMVFGIGPGLIVNQGFKHFWGRPRPAQVQQFGGTMEFVPVGEMGPLTKNNSSFPSGHAAVAYYVFAPAFLIHARRQRLARRLLIFGLIFGAGMSATRIVQGGHFFSDVVWSAGIVYFVCVVCARLLLLPRLPSTSIPSSQSCQHSRQCSRDDSVCHLTAVDESPPRRPLPVDSPEPQTLAFT